ncbi:MAG: hypothetical protein GEU95_24880 [Rhizobiales bacterium]|nr:hypothetical protein [Hyphomicrobiales bacterium]
MLRVLTDFNARTQDDLCFILKYGGVDLNTRVDELGLSKGDKVILYPDEEDFEVIAILDKRYVDVLGELAWVGIPEWSTIVRK